MRFARNIVFKMAHLCVLYKELVLDRSENINPHLGKNSLKPHKFIMHVCFDSIHIN